MDHFLSTSSTSRDQIHDKPTGLQCTDVSTDQLTDKTEEETPVQLVDKKVGGDSKRQLIDIDQSCLKINVIAKTSSQMLEYEFHCVVCNRNLEDSKKTQQHLKSESHCFKLEEYYIDYYLPVPTTQQYELITDLILTTYTKYSASEQGQTFLREAIVTELDKQVKRVIDPNVTVELFGSSVTGFALSSSDVNINLNIGSDIENSQAKIPKILLNILYLLRTTTDLYSDVRDDFYSPLKVPRILFKHKPSNLLCELRAGSIAPVTLSSLLAVYSSLDQRVSQLCVSFKYLANILQVDRQIDGHYPSVIFVLFVIHYLQQTTPPILPVLHEMVPVPERPAHADNEDVDEKEVDPDISQLMGVAKDWKTQNQQTLGELLCGLLKYYVCEFDISKYAVSIRQSTPLLRKDRYWGVTRLAVEDPVISKSNIGRGTGSDKIFEYLQICLKHSLSHLLQVNTKINSLKQKLTSKNFDISQQEQLSIIVPVPEDTVVEEQETEQEIEEEVKNEEETERMSGEEEQEQETAPIERKLTKNQKKRKNMQKRKEISAICQLLESMEINERSLNGWLQDNTLRYLRKMYPIACILCKRSKHLAIECPDENVPKLQREPPFPPVKFLKLIDYVLYSYMKEVMLQPQEERDRIIICNEVLSDIRKLYPKATLELFGSSANGFGHCQSDLDLCLLMNEPYECEKSEIIEKLAKSFKKNPRYSHVVSILSARVPIAKMYITSWKIEGDVSLENCLALQNTKMLHTYCTIDNRVRPLGYTIKSFAKACDMCDAATGSLSSYAYIIMLIHYLQQLPVPVLPVLQKLPYNSPQDGPIIDSWNCYFFKPKNMEDLMNTWRPLARNTLSISQLWLGFLKYYARDFDWAHQVVTMRQLQPLSKFEKWWNSKPMAIEDPFNLDHNLGQAVSGHMRTYILMRFQKAYFHHCKPKPWKDIDDLMDSNILCGDFKAPKFILCDTCGRRGHKAAECPTCDIVLSVGCIFKSRSKGITALCFLQVTA